MIPHDPNARPLVGEEAEEWLKLREEGIDLASEERRSRLAGARQRAEGSAAAWIRGHEILSNL